MHRHAARYCFKSAGRTRDAGMFRPVSAIHTKIVPFVTNLFGWLLISLIGALDQTVFLRERATSWAR